MCILFILFFQIYLEFCLKPTWDWLLTVMDATEAQLRFGASLTHSVEPGHVSHPISPAVPSGGKFLIIFFFTVNFIVFCFIYKIKQWILCLKIKFGNRKVKGKNVPIFTNNNNIHFSFFLFIYNCLHFCLQHQHRPM